MIVFKLTSREMKTRVGYPQETQWVLGEWKAVLGKGDLCTDGWLHAYSHPLIAILRNCRDANIINPRLFEAEVDGVSRVEALKGGYQRMRLVREIPLPTMTIAQRLQFAVLCACYVGGCDAAEWRMWLTDYCHHHAGAACRGAFPERVAPRAG